MPITSSPKELEEKASCAHTSTSREVIGGQKTGDRVCNDCGMVLAPKTTMRTQNK